MTRLRRIGPDTGSSHGVVPHGVVPRAHCHGAPCRGATGAATAEFVLVVGLLMLLFVGALHLGLALHVRNLAQDAAVHGARYGALEDRGPRDGVRRAEDLLATSLGGALHPRVTATAAGSGGGVTVRVQAAVPLFGFLPGPHVVHVEASASGATP